MWHKTLSAISHVVGEKARNHTHNLCLIPTSMHLRRKRLHDKNGSPKPQISTQLYRKLSSLCADLERHIQTTVISSNSFQSYHTALSWFYDFWLYETQLYSWVVLLLRNYLAVTERGHFTFPHEDLESYVSTCRMISDNISLCNYIL